MSSDDQDRGEGSLAAPITLAFHKLTPGFTFGSTNYAPGRFERLLSFLAGSGFSLDSHSTTPSLRISFDDGYQHLRDFLPPLMDRLGFQPTVFVPTDLIGRHNRWDYSSRLAPERHLDETSLRELAALGVQFGSHGRSHADLTACDAGSLRSELEDSRKRLQDLTGQPIDEISYPFGRTDARVQQTAALAGYARGYTMEFPTPEHRPLATGRIGVYCFDTRLTVFHKVTGGRLYRLERLKARVTNRLSGGTIILNRLRRHQ